MKKQIIPTIICICLILLVFACKKDGETEPENTPNPTPESCGDLVIGGITYETVRIGDQCWMAENLDYYVGSGSWAIPFPDLEDYGMLYNYSNAKLGAPDGWHLPTLDDWLELAQFISDQHGGYEIALEDYEWLNVGGHLKATTGWPADFYAGTDDYGFAVYPAGNRYYELSTGDDSYDPRGMFAFYWTSTQEADGRVRMIMFEYDTDSFITTWIEECRLVGDGYSVRYVKD